MLVAVVVVEEEAPSSSSSSPSNELGEPVRVEKGDSEVLFRLCVGDCSRGDMTSVLVVAVVIVCRSWVKVIVIQREKEMRNEKYYTTR